MKDIFVKTIGWRRVLKVLIFSASAGNGHNSAANRIRNKFLEEQPDAVVEIVDVYHSYGSKIKSWIIEKGYFFVCKHAVGLYNHFFKKTENKKFENRDKLGANGYVEELMFGMLSKIYDFQPDLIVSTYIYASVALANLRRVYNIPVPIASMSLDYGISPYWECIAPYTDMMFLTHEGMIDDYVARGFSKEKLFATGIPIGNQFSNLKGKKECRDLLGLDKDLFTILIMKAGFFPIKEKVIFDNLKKLDTKIQVVIVNGCDEKSRKKIDKLIKKYKLSHNIQNLGFTNQISEYFSACDIVLGKAGGLTTTETLTAGIPSLIVNKLPQQEIYNKDFMVENKCAICVEKNNMASTINDLVKNPNKLEEMRKNCLKTRIVHSLDKMYDVLKTVPVANYEGVNLIDSKKQLVKKVRKARKERIRQLNRQKKSK